MKKAVANPIVYPVLQQHIEDAAFYWLRRQDGLWKPAFKASHVAHLDRLLDAHLEGLVCAGHPAFDLCLARMQQWKTADEAFVSTYALTHHIDDHRVDQLSMLMDHESAKGAAAALLWSDSDCATTLADQWWRSEQDCLRLAAIPFLTNRLSPSTAWFEQAANDACPQIRAHVFKLIGEQGLQRYAFLLRRALTDTNEHCRFEAAAALYLLGESHVDLTLIRDAIPQLTGFTQRRALLLWASSSDRNAFAHWLTSYGHQPENSRNRLWSMAFRGESDYLPVLCDLLERQVEPKLTAYVISHITGVNIDTEGFWLKDARNEDDDGFVEHEHTEDDGLLRPDVNKLITWVGNNMQHFKKQTRYLNGKPLGDSTSALFKQGWQPQRWQAGVTLTITQHKRVLPNVRQPLYSAQKPYFEK